MRNLPPVHPPALPRPSSPSGPDTLSCSPAITPSHASSTFGSRSHFASQVYRPPQDDLLVNLDPEVALETLLKPTGPLRVCLDSAPASERSFALRAASASAYISTWLSELHAWPWPGPGCPAPFMPPPSLLPPSDHPHTTQILFSTDVTQRRARIDQISAALGDLGIGEMHRHLLHTHILPLSRNPRPGSDFDSPSSSCTSVYNKMEDITAVIASIIVRALPNLRNLSRLLRIWSARLAVLQRVASFLCAISSAELALSAAWETISTPRSDIPGAKSETLPSATGHFSHSKVDSLRLALEVKVSKPGRIIDSMLDILEGSSDLLPDEWLYRTEGIENDHAEWVAAAQLALRALNWIPAQKRHRSVSPNPVPNKEVLAQVRDNGAADFDADVVDLPGWPAPEEKDDDALPPLLHLNGRRPSNGSVASTIIRDASGLEFAVTSSPTSSPVKPLARRLFEHIRATAVTTDDSSNLPSSQPSVRPIGSSHRPRHVLDSDTLEPESPINPATLRVSPISLLKGSEADRENGSYQLRQQISDILDSIPGKFRLMDPARPNANTNSPEVNIAAHNRPVVREPRIRRTTSSVSVMSSRAPTPSYTLSPAKKAFSKRPNRGNRQETQVYHLSRSTGGPPIQLFIRLTGENGERVMVRVGGGWADLGEYLKEYASHHGRRSGNGSSTVSGTVVDMRDSISLINRASSPAFSSSPTQPVRSASALDSYTMTPIAVRKKRLSFGPQSDDLRRAFLPQRPRTPASDSPLAPDPISEADDRPKSTAASYTPGSRPSSRLSGKSAADDGPILGLAGPTSRRVEMSDESWAWVESVKERVRLASGERRGASASAPVPPSDPAQIFGDLGKVRGTQRLFRKR